MDNLRESAAKAVEEKAAAKREKVFEGQVKQGDEHSTAGKEAREGKVEAGSSTAKKRPASKAKSAPKNKDKK